MGFLRCVLYFAVLGILSFLIGRVLPKTWFRWDRFPYRSYRWEREGRAYEKIGIRRWQSRIPDMSRILPGAMPAKKISGLPDEETLTVMLRETCVAELIHWLLMPLGLACFLLWKGPGGLVMFLLYVLLGNLPFVLVQRYNRPRLARLLRRLQQGKHKKGE